MRFIASIILACLFLVSPVAARAGDLSLSRSDWVSNPDYSHAGDQVKINNPFNFNIPIEPREVGYVHRAASVKGFVKIRIEYEITGTGTLIAQGESPPARIALYFQKANDNWQCTKTGIITKQTQYYRWWSVVRTELKPGRHVVEVRLDDPAQWGSCWGVRANANSGATTAFNDAKSKSFRVGFTFGGGSSAGHGISVKRNTGTVNFRLIKYTLVSAL